MKAKEQKLMIENLLSSHTVFSRCSGIIKPDFFEPAFRPLITFSLDYFEKYHNIPEMDVINAKFEGEFKTQQITTDKVRFTCDNLELFCKQMAMSKAVLESIEDIEKGDFGKMTERIALAQLVSLQKEMGTEIYSNIRETLISYIDTQKYYPTNIAVLDNYLDGGFARKQLTLFSANSGVGKSNMMANLGANYARAGLDVLYITLELPESMIHLRLASMLSGFPIKQWKDNIENICEKLIGQKDDGAGTFYVKRMASGTTANDIRSYLKQYELEFGRKPDVIIIDYLDLMYPNGGIKNIGVFEQDKLKTEQLYEIMDEYDAIGITASQQNREAIRMSTPDQAVIAGGLSKVNTVDNYISLYATPEMKAKGELFIYFLKTRSSDAVGQSAMLHFNVKNLRITDPVIGTPKIELLKNRKAMFQEMEGMGISIQGLPGISEDDKKPSRVEEFIADAPEIEIPAEITTAPTTMDLSGANNLIDLMTSFN